MTGVEIIIALLHAHDPLIAQVPKAAVMAGALDQGTAAPAIRVINVAGTDLAVLKTGASRHSTHRVQVDVLAATYRQLLTLLRLVRTACAGTVGSVAGATNVAVVIDTLGPDELLEQPRLFLRAQDFSVSFNAPR